MLFHCVMSPQINVFYQWLKSLKKLRSPSKKYLEYSAPGVRLIANGANCLFRQAVLGKERKKLRRFKA